MTEISEYLEFVRQRRDHLRQVYFQQESRAQVVFVFAVAVAGGLMGAIGGSLGLLVQSAGLLFWLSLGIFGVSLLFSFLLGLTAIIPLNGRHFFGSGKALDRWLSDLGHWSSGRSSGMQIFMKKPDIAGLRDFAAQYLHVGPPESEDGNVVQSAVLTAELYHVWALWTATVRKAGLLRVALIFLALGLVSALPVYLEGKEIIGKLGAGRNDQRGSMDVRPGVEIPQIELRQT